MVEDLLLLYIHVTYVNNNKNLIEHKFSLAFVGYSCATDL